MKKNIPEQSLENLVPWKSGEQAGKNNLYGKYLASLSDEERELHIAERARKSQITRTSRKTVNELWNSAISANNVTWNEMLQQAAQSVLQRAIERGDPVAFNAVTDRILGKVATTMTVNVKENDTEQDILKQIQAVAMNSMEKQLEKDEQNNVKHAIEYVDEHTELNNESKNYAKTKD